MKKLAYIFAIGGALIATSCVQNTEPKFERAVTMELNTPPLANQLFTLTPDGTIDLSWSQPEWGFAAPASYQVEVSFEEDFHYYNNSTADYYYTIPTVFNKCSVQIPMEQVAIAMCTLRGIKAEEDYTQEPPRPIYLRVHGYINGIELSSVYSNSIRLEQVEGYCAVQSPAKIYLVGQPEGWIGPEAGNAKHYADWALSEAEDAIGSNVFYGSFSIAAETAMFRYYTALTGWDADSWGSQQDDNPIDFEFTDGQFHNPINGPGWKGSFNFPDWTTSGTMDMTVDLNEKTVTIIANN